MTLPSPVAPSSEVLMSPIHLQRPVTRPERGHGAVIAGVAAGVADALGLSRTLVRVLFVLAGLVGAGELAYLVLWLLLPPRRSRNMA